MAGKSGKRRNAGHSREILFGFHPVAEALAAGRRKIHSLFVDRANLSERQAGIVQLAEKKGIPWQVQSPEQIQAAAESSQHQGIAAAVSPLPNDALGTIFAKKKIPAPLVVLLDGIVDPHNLGAIVRTAHCVGADALVVPKDRAAGATPVVSKVSAGALEHTRICRVTNLANSIQWLQKKGFWVAGLAMEGKQTLFEADLKGSLALAIGSEGKGLRRLVKEHCDFLVSIPLQGRVDSLNASAAAAVVLYEAFRQRRT
jgi:23S rRNA (guanosine2251-2'-O)-methyltransferase